MMQTITKLNIAPAEPAKEYFAAIDRRDKLAFLEKPQMSWQETLDYLQNYWNAGNIQGLCAHLSKPLRRRYCGNAAAIMSTVSYMDTLLLQNKKIIWHNAYAEQTEGIVRIEQLDRKMCRWQLDSYGQMHEENGRYLLENYCLISMRRIMMTENERTKAPSLGVIKLPETCGDIPLRGMTYQKKEDGFGVYTAENAKQKIIIADKTIICSAEDRQLLRKTLRQTVNALRLDIMRVSLNGELVIIRGE